MSDRETTRTLLERLRRHYIKPGPLPGGVFVPECGINGGPQTRADALYVGFTSASGRILVGHELKVSRADWRKELDTAGKADFWADNCHAWYVVAPSTDIVPPAELPHGWGLMVPNARTTTRMDVKVKATVHADRVPDWAATRSILARLDTLRAHHDHEVQQKARDEATAAAEERLQQRIQAQDRQALTPEQDRRLHALDRLENILGARLSTWFDDNDAVRPEVVAAALRLAESREAMLERRIHGYEAKALRTAAESMLAGLDEFQSALTDLRELIP